MGTIHDSFTGFTSVIKWDLDTGDIVSGSPDYFPDSTSTSDYDMEIQAGTFTEGERLNSLVAGSSYALASFDMTNLSEPIVLGISIKKPDRTVINDLWQNGGNIKATVLDSEFENTSEVTEGQIKLVGNHITGETVLYHNGERFQSFGNKLNDTTHIQAFYIVPATAGGTFPPLPDKRRSHPYVSITDLAYPDVGENHRRIFRVSGDDVNDTEFDGDYFYFNTMARETGAAPDDFSRDEYHDISFVWKHDDDDNIFLFVEQEYLLWWRIMLVRYDSNEEPVEWYTKKIHSIRVEDMMVYLNGGFNFDVPKAGDKTKTKTISQDFDELLPVPPVSPAEQYHQYLQIAGNSTDNKYTGELQNVYISHGDGYFAAADDWHDSQEVSIMGINDTSHTYGAIASTNPYNWWDMHSVYHKSGTGYVADIGFDALDYVTTTSVGVSTRPDMTAGSSVECYHKPLGLLGTSLQFSSNSNTGLSCTDVDSITSLYDDSFTFTCTFVQTSSGNQTLFDFDKGEEEDGSRVKIGITSNGAIEVDCDDFGILDGKKTADSLIDTDTVYHLVVTVVPGTPDITIYVNGEDETDGTSAMQGEMWNGDEKVTIGKPISGSTYFTGFMQHVALYDRKISSNEIYNLHKSVNYLTPLEEAILNNAPINWWTMADYSIEFNEVIANDKMTVDDHDETYLKVGSKVSVGTDPIGHGDHSAKFVNDADSGMTRENPVVVALPESGEDWTFECLLEQTDNTGQQDIFNGHWGDDKEVRVQLTGGKVAVLVRRSSSTTKITANVVISEDTTHHLAVTHSSSGVLKIYVDGDLQSLGKSPKWGSGTDADAICIGKRYVDDTLRFIGYMQHVALYDKVLSAEDIEDHAHLV